MLIKVTQKETKQGVRMVDIPIGQQLDHPQRDIPCTLHFTQYYLNILIVKLE